MSGFMSLFIKPKGQEASDSEETDIDVDALLAEMKTTTDAMHQAEEVPSSPTVAVSSGTGVGITENRPLAEIYQQAGVTDNGMTITKVIAVMKGLQALPPDAQKVAIRAMDDADDSWSLADVHRDAKQRVAALKGEKARLRNALDAESQAAAGEVAALDEAAEEVRIDIESQIQTLQNRLAEQLGEAAARRQQTQDRVQATQSAFERENGRLDREIARLTQAVGALPVAIPDTTESGE